MDTICEKCHKPVLLGQWPYCPHPEATTAMIAGDECDVIIRHGACWPDGTPRRYRSKAEIKKVAFEAGWTQGFDTPKVNQRIVEKEQFDRERRSKSDRTPPPAKQRKATVILPSTRRTECQQ